jgi:hypothetical protein
VTPGQYRRVDAPAADRLGRYESAVYESAVYESTVYQYAVDRNAAPAPRFRHERTREILRRRGPTPP